MNKQITAAMMMLTMLAAPVMAQDLQQQAFEAKVFHTEAGKPVQLAELSQQEMKETEGAWAPFVLSGLIGGNIGAWGNHTHTRNKTGQFASVNSTLKATGAGMVAGASVYGGGRVASFAKHGREIKIGNDLRIAPFGNRTGHQYGKYPHYHRRVVDSSGKTLPGQGIGRHRPWETKSTDTSWKNRF